MVYLLINALEYEIEILRKKPGDEAPIGFHSNF